MNAFDAGRLVEARGMTVLTPFLSETAEGRIVILEKGPLARALQETVGDAIIQKPDGRAWSVEIKVEERNKHGRIFLESWSNRNLESRDSYVARGNNPGWFLKIGADLLLYYFLAEDELFAFDLFKLKEWAFSEGVNSAWRVCQWQEYQQRKRVQLNDTRGWCVPLDVLKKEVGYKLIRVKQLALPTLETALW